MVRREIFGPVVTVSSFEDEAQALAGERLDYGPGVFGMDRRCGAHRPGRPPAIRLHLGQHHFMLVSEMPHGGVKLSGCGRDLSMYGRKTAPWCAT